MFDIEINNKWKYFLFGKLYFVEGLVFSISTVVIPLYLLDKGFSPEIITMVVGIRIIPWSLKFIWGGITDYFIKLGRKKFIIFGGLFAGFGTVCLGLINPSDNIGLFTLFIILSYTGLSFLDVSTDAWAIQVSKTYERGKISGIMDASQNIALALGNFSFLFIVKIYSWDSTFFLSGLIILTLIFINVFFSEKRIILNKQDIRGIIKSEFKKKYMQLLLVLSPLIVISYGLIIATIPIYLEKGLNFDFTEIGFITAIFPIAMIFGSLLGGFIADKLARKKVLFVILCLNAIFPIFLIYGNSLHYISLIYGIIGFLIGGLLTVINAIFMDVSNPKICATHFSILTSFVNVGYMIGFLIAGSLITGIGFYRVFLISSWIYGPALIILYLIKIKKVYN